MKKRTDFAKYLEQYFSEHLPYERNVSINTQKAYRDVFVQYIDYMKTVHHISAEQLTLESFTKNNIIDFLKRLLGDKGCSISTRNHRLNAFKSFARYLQYNDIARIGTLQDIISIPLLKHDTPVINYLSVEGIKLLLSQPDLSSPRGKRHLLILSLMYETGARVQEICDLKVNSLRIENKPYTIRLFGKGNKGRVVPLSKEIVTLLRDYIECYHLSEIQMLQHPLFFNNRHEKLTRAGITYILESYVKMARQENSSIIPSVCSCHSLRHSRAMHLLQAGVNIVYIRDILGHSSVKTTEMYARSDSRFKQEALEKAYVDTIPNINLEKAWDDDDLREWLKKL